MVGRYKKTLWLLIAAFYLAYAYGMLVHKNKTEITDYNVVFAEEDIELMHSIATENLMEAKALHDEPSPFDTYWFDDMVVRSSGEGRSRIIPFHLNAVSYLIDKLREYSDSTEERAERAARSAPEGHGDRAWFDRTVLGQAALMFATELEEKFVKIRQTELEAEARTVIAGSALTADQWLRTLSEGQ